MRDEIWLIALFVDGAGIFIALLALVGHLTTTTIDGERGERPHEHVSSFVQFLLPFIFTAGLLAFGGVVTWQGWLGHGLTDILPTSIEEYIPPRLTAYVTLTRSTLIIYAGYLNSLMLARMVYVAGGVFGLFTPLFLLVPHTTAVFLSRTEHQFHIFGVLATTLALYLIVYCRGTNREITRKTAHGIWSIIVLGLSILVEIYLIFATRHT